MNKNTIFIILAVIILIVVIIDRGARIEQRIARKKSAKSANQVHNEKHVKTLESDELRQIVEDGRFGFSAGITDAQLQKNILTAINKNKDPESCSICRKILQESGFKL